MAVLRALLLAALVLLPLAAGMRSKKVDALAVEGGVSDALGQLLSELKQQLTLQEKAKSDTISDRLRKEAEKKQKEAELDHEDDWYKFWNWGVWNDKLANLKQAISSLNEDIAALRRMEQAQEQSIAKLGQALQSKSDAQGLAQDLERLIADLSEQIAAKEALFAAEADEDQRELAMEERMGEEKVQIFARMVREVHASVASIKEEHARLLEVHSTQLCTEKEAKQETICARCSGAEVACGSGCIPEMEQCHHDVGCACNEAAGSLVQLNDATHPLRQRIADAKAELRKVIAMHQATVNNLEASIAIDEQAKAETEQQKQDAMQEFDEAIKQLEQNLAQAQQAHASARANKAAAESELEKVTADGEKAKAALAAQLAASRRSLSEELEEARAAQTNQMMANKERLEALLDSHEVSRNQLRQEIEELRRAKAEAEARLDSISAAHL